MRIWQTSKTNHGQILDIIISETAHVADNSETLHIVSVSNILKPLDITISKVLLRRVFVKTDTCTGS